VNELLFILHSLLISIFAVIALKISKEALISFLCVQAILSNLFVSKQIILFGFCATCSDAFSVGSSLSLNLLQEYFGKQIAQKTIWISFFCLIFYLLMTQMHLIYIPSEFDIMQKNFYEIFQFAPRIVIASLIAYLISQQIDLRLYNFFKKKFEGKYFILRNYGSLLISQFVDTLIFTFLGLYSIVENPLQIFTISYFVKVFTIILAAPIVGILKKILENKLF